MASRRYNKLLWRTSGLYRVLRVQWHAVIIGEPAYRATPLTVLHSDPQQHRWSVSRTKRSKYPDHEIEVDSIQMLLRTRGGDKDCRLCSANYVVSPEMCLVDSPHRRKCVVKWYGYGPQDNNFEPAEHVTMPFKNRYSDEQEIRRPRHHQR